MMAFMKNINDLIEILALLVLTTPSLAANIDCNGKPFHCLNSTHFMICVDLGSGVSSTIDDFVIPCPPTTVCKGTNKFECEFVVVTTTTIAPSVVPLTSVSEQTTPLYEVTTSIPFEEYYNTLSTTTLSEDILITQHSATEPTIQPATDMLQNIDVTTSGSDLNSNFNDIVLSTNVQNNLTTLWPTVISSTLSEGITTAKTIAQNDFANLNTVTNTFLSNNVTESTLLQTKAVSNVSTLSVTIHSVDLVENDKNTDLMWATVTELTPNEITSSVQNNQEQTTTLSNNLSTTASDLSSNTVEIASVAITKPDKDSSVTETTQASETDQNEHTLLTTLPINTEAITKTSIPETTVNIKVTANIPLSNNAADNATDSILLEASSSASVSEAILNKDVKNYPNTKFMLAEVTESTLNENTVNKSIPIVDVVQNSLKTIILLSKNISVNATYYVTENTIVTETKPEMNFTLSEISDLVTTISPINVDTTTTPIPLKYIPETFQNVDIITPESGPTATAGFSKPLHTSFVNNITNTVIPPTLVVASDSVQSLDVVQNNFTTHPLINNAIKPILFEEAETTSSETKSETLKENTQNVEDVRNDFKVTESLFYDNSTNATDVISNATENGNMMMFRPERNKTLIENSTFFSDNIANKITESIRMEATQTTPAPDIVNKYLKMSTTLFNNINDNVTEPIVYHVTENINPYESNLTLSVPALSTPRNVTVQSNFMRKLVTDSTATNLPTTESINIPFTESVQTLPANEIIKITENPFHATTEYNADTTSSESLSGQSTFYETNYIKPNTIQNNKINKSVVPTKTEHTANTDNVLINSLMNEINKSSITKNYKHVADSNSTTEALVHAATENYIDSSHISTVVTDGDVINSAGSTLNPVLETTTFVQEVDSITYTRVNNHTDTENIGIQSNQIIFTNKTGGKPTFSEKVLSPIVVENTTITSTLNMINNNFTSSLAKATNATVPKLTSRTDIDTLIKNTEAKLFVNQATHTQGDLVLGINTNDSVLLQSNFKNYATIHLNESHSGLPVLATSLERTPTAKIPTGASETTSSKTKSETLKENTQNVEDVRNDFKVTEISNATENVNVMMFRPERNKTLIENSTFLSDTIANKITESIRMEATQTTPAPDIVNKYLKMSTTLFNNINDNVTEPIVYHVTENINLYKSNITLSVPALTMPSNVTMQSNFITKPVTDSTATNLPKTESINITFTESVQTLPANVTIKITENPIHATTEYNADTTSSESLSGQSTFYETNYIKPNNIQNNKINKSVVQTKTEHTANTDNVLINSLMNEINKSSITKNYKHVADSNSTTEALVHAATENYIDSSHISTVVTDGDVINSAGSTLNPVLETTTFVQEVDSITYSRVNYHTDTENISIQSDQIIFTNKTGGKPTLSEKVLSPGVVENTTITPTLNMINNNFTSSLVIATNATVPKLTSRTDIDTLIMNTEAKLFVNQATHTQGDLVLGINTNDSVLLQSNFKNYATIHVNESHSGLPVLATSLERTPTAEIPTGASDEAMVKPASIADSSTLSTMTANLPVTTADTIQVITTDPTTMETIFTVTETSEVIFSDTTNHVQAPHVLNTESAASQDFLTSPVYIDGASGTTLEASLKETNTSSLNTINDATTPFTPNTKMSMDLFYSAKEVVATEAANIPNNEPPLHTESSKSKLDKKNILTQITVPPLSAHNVPTEIVSTFEIQLTSVPLAVHLDFGTNLQKYETEQGNSNPINPDLFASLYKTDLLVQNIVAVAKKSKSSSETSGKMLASPSTASIGVEAIRKPNNVINLLLDSPTKQIPDIRTTAPTETISLISTAIPLETAADVAATAEPSKTTTETDPFADSRTEQDPDTESKINNIGANIQKTFPPKKTLTNGDLHTLLNTDKETGVSIQKARNIPNGQTSITQQKTSENPIKHTQTSVLMQVFDFQESGIPSAAIEKSKPYIHITSSLDATQPTERVSRPYTESPVTNDNTAHIVNRLNEDTDVSNSKTEHIVVPKYVTPPSNIDEKLVLEAKSTNRLTTESPSTMPYISESTVQTASKHILDTVTPDLGLVKIINISNKGSDFDLTTKHHIMSPKTEFTKVPKVVDQTTVHIKNSIGTNLDKDVVIMDSVKTEVPVLVQNNELTGTHLGISTLPNAKVQESENTEANESVKQPESPERNEGIQKTTTVIDRTITESSKLLDTNDKTPLERTTEMTTKKMEDNSERGDQSITNIESTVKPPTLSLAETNADDRSPKEKSVTNIHNTSLPIVKTVTNSQNFVCKLNNRGRFSDSNDCRKFYICIGKSEPIVGFCPNNTVFSELWKQCTKNLSHCVRNHQFQCVREGRFSDFLNDKNYYICVKNNVGTFIRFKLQCQSGYHLNKTSVHCELNTESSQSTSQTSTSSVSINSGSDQSVSSVKSEKLVYESSNEFECKEEGKFPDADNCRKYYVCKKIGKSQYRRKSKKCDSDDLFDKNKKKCVDADSHECS